VPGAGRADGKLTEVVRHRDARNSKPLSYRYSGNSTPSARRVCPLLTTHAPPTKLASHWPILVLPALDVCKCPQARALITATKNLVKAKKTNGTFDPKVFLATVNHGRTVSRYAKDAVIFPQGSPADAVFYIQKGRIKLVVESEQGKEAVIALLGPGEFFGEGCLIGQPLRLATARAMVESQVMRVGKAEMIRVLHVEPAFGEVFTAHLLTRNSRVEADLVDQLFNSSEKRLARALLMLAHFGKEGEPQAITTKISQETLAEIIGTTRPRVSQFMNKFRKLGFIEYNGHLKVHSSLLSVVLRH
jgi:CRP/FNR family transcriptional regulator, cyclic AMP receptor protein